MTKPRDDKMENGLYARWR